MTIEEKIKETIRCSGKSVSAVAIDARIPSPSLYRFVNGQQGLSMETLQKLVDYFGFELQPKRDGTPRSSR